ncbi:MAG: sialidase family protein [Candidatus Udaeobacter sp.]
MSAAAAMAFVAAKTSGPPILGKSNQKGQAKLVRSEAAKRHFETVLGRAEENGQHPGINGAAQERYDDQAYPAKFIQHAQVRAAAISANRIRMLQSPMSNTWQEVGPDGVPADALVASESTGATAGGIYSGRATAMAISTTNPNQILIGAAGGGVWRTDNGNAPKPHWQPYSDGIPSNAIGSLIFDPTDRGGHTLYAGTGEPNGSGDSEAGVGLYKSTDQGHTWTLVAGSTAVATGRSIGSIAIDPANGNHIFIGTDVARHGSSSVNGGRFTPPGAPPVGLYESTDGGATFSPAVILTQDAVDPSNATGGDFFRAGCSHIELYRPGSETQVYASFFDYGVYRRSMTQDGDTAFHQVFNSAGGGTVPNSSTSRTEFSLAPNGSPLRVYVGDTGNGGSADFYRVDNANVPAATLVTAGTNGGWTKLSSPANGTPGFGSRNYCLGQCSYDMPVYSPPGAPNIVYIGGALQYGELGGRSNGRGIQRSEDAGVNFTDMTIDTHGVSLHPDQHAIAALPSNPNIVYIGDDGGIFRLDGSFSDISSQCSSRGLTGNNLIDCMHWLSKVPTSITTLNDGLGTLQFQSLSLNHQSPKTDIMGGTQDNGTQAFSSTNKDGNNGKWFVTIFGDGGQSGINVASPNIRMHTFTGPSGDVNFSGEAELGWDFMTDPPALSGEGASFYLPLIADPNVGGTWFMGLQHVWRTQDNAGPQAYLDMHCNEFTGDFTVECGDWVAIGQDLTSTSFGTDKEPDPSGYVVATSRAPSDTGTLWAGLRRGRVFVASNADNATPGAVTFYRIDTSAQPTRFVSGISVDASNPNHAFISFSGYNAYAIASGTAIGHVFEVTYDPGTQTATWSSDLAGGDPPSGLGDQPVTGIAVHWNTGDVYVSTDFGVFVRKSGNTTWQQAGASLPPVAVYGLSIDLNGKILYAATHGRGAWKLDLSH